MKWIYHEKIKSEWQKWFAWKPVPIGKYPLDNRQTIVWLQFVERKWIDCRGSNSYEYREIRSN